MKKIIVFSVLVAIFFYSGCGMVGLMGTPTRHERKIAAEYDLAGDKEQKILVLVHQPGWLNAQVNLRYYLTDAMINELIKKLKIPSERLIAYGELAEFRSNKGDFSLLSHAEVGEALGADVVLLIMVENYHLSKMAETDYYSGFLGAQAALLDTATGEKLWPKSAEGKSIKVGFEVEEKGRGVAVRRLAAACAYCTTRYFYNCPMDKFKIYDDKSRVGWEGWKK